MGKSAIDNKKLASVQKMGIAGLVHIDVLMVPMVIETTRLVNDNLQKLMWQRKELALAYFKVEGDDKRNAILESFDIVSDEILKIIGF